MTLRTPVVGLIVVAILMIPFTTNSNYILRLINIALIYSLLSVSLNIVLGYAGQIALGHAAFFGIGAYTAALISADGSGLLFLAGLRRGWDRHRRLGPADRHSDAAPERALLGARHARLR